MCTRRRLVLVAVATLFLAVPVLATPFTIDQFNPDICPTCSGFNLENISPMGQSFTPTLSGLDVVQIVVADFHPFLLASPTVRITIHDGDLNGAILGHVDMVVPDPPDPIVHVPVTETLEFDFPSVISITPGNTYTFEVTMLDSPDKLGIFGSTTDTYSGGTAFLSTNSGPMPDIFFAEGLSTPAAVPEPSTLSLLGIGIVGLIGYKSRHKVWLTASRGQTSH